MLELYSMVWMVAVLNAILGFLRGWRREIIVTAGVVLGMFVLFQFDVLLRGVFLASMGRDQNFILQMLIFALIVYFAYRARFGLSDRAREGLAAGILGSVMGFINGYMIGGMIWYFLDINEYPFSGFITAPAPGSASAEAIQILPMVVMSGGVNGSGDFLTIASIAVIMMVIIAL